jgi:CHAT domain-containing protein/tetratricopeptide (TPR) repeat protein
MYLKRFRHLVQLIIGCAVILLLAANYYLYQARLGSAPNPTSNLAEAYELLPSTAVAQEIAGDTSQTYAMQLAAGQSWHAVLVKGDLQLLVTIQGPDGQPCGEFISSRYAPLQVSFITPAPGGYRLKVSSLEAREARGRYDLKVTAVHSASAADQQADRATRLFNEAEKLRAAWTEQALQAAITKYDDAFALWRTLGRGAEAADTARAIGETYFMLSKYQPALSYYKAALALSQAAGDPRGAAAALNGISDIYTNTGKEAQALALAKRVEAAYEHARPAARDAEYQRVEAQALLNMGVVYYSRGDLSAALKVFERALALAQAGRDRHAQASVRLNMGHAYTDSGDPQRALEEFTKALALWRAVGARRGEALALTATAGLDAFFGKKQLALELHQQARQIFLAIGDHHGEAVALNGVARSYEELNELPTALDNYTQALQLFQQNKSAEFEAVTEYCIGRVYRSMVNSAQALEHYRRSIALSRASGKRRIAAYAQLGIASIHTSLGQVRQGLGEYQKILALYKEIGDRRGLAHVLNNVGDIHYAAGARTRALRYYERALPLNRAAKDSNDEAATLYNIARAERACGRLEAARADIEAAIKIIEFQRLQIASPTLRSSYFASVRQHYGFYIDLLMQLAQLRPAEGFAAAAFQASESARARVLLESLAESAVNIRQGVNPELLAKEHALQQLLSTKAQYQSRLLNNANTAGASATLARELRQLNADYEEVQAQIREQSPRYAALTQPAPLRLADVQKELQDDQTLLLEYALGQERSYLWAVSSTSVNSYVLPGRAQLEAATREVYDLLTAPRPIEGETTAARQARLKRADELYAERARALSQMLLGPVAAQLGERRLLIVADGALQYLPFAALPTPDTDNPPAAGALLAPNEPVPLVVQHEIINLPSAATLAALRRETLPAASTNEVVAVLADPVFEADDPRVQRDGRQMTQPKETEAGAIALRMALRDVEGLGRSWRLPFTRQEGEEIISLIPADGGLLATSFEANLATATSTRLGRYQVIHFATHGLVNREHPELSGILLSLVNTQGQPQEGLLQLHDIYNLTLASKLVVLSACDSGLGKDVNGEGLVGLTRGFMYAGSKSVMASLWQVEDKATAELMHHFYQALLKDGQPPAAALRTAQIAMWREQPAPYYWAGFVLQGEYADRIIIAHDARQPSRALSLLLLLLALSVGYFLGARLKVFKL